MSSLLGPKNVHGQIQSFFFGYVAISDLPVNNCQKKRADCEHLGSILWGSTILNNNVVLVN